MSHKQILSTQPKRNAVSKEIARSAQSYENEQLALAQMLEPHGFSAVAAKRAHGMKFVDAKAADGENVRFWLKQGLTGPQKFSAIQFGLFSERRASAIKPELASGSAVRTDQECLCPAYFSHGLTPTTVQRLPSFAFGRTFTVRGITPLSADAIASRLIGVEGAGPMRSFA